MIMYRKFCIDIYAVYPLKLCTLQPSAPYPNPEPVTCLHFNIALCACVNAQCQVLYYDSKMNQNGFGADVIQVRAVVRTLRST
jgi:hypothetical protein